MDLRGPRTRASSQNERLEARSPVDRFCVRAPPLFNVFPAIKSLDPKSAMVLRDLHVKGGTREQIEGALKIMPVVRTTPFPSISMLF